MTYPLPAPAVPLTRVIIDWIAGLGWDTTQESGYPLFPGPEILDAPDRAVFITGAPGPGWVTEEGTLDCSGFQVRLRGPANDPFTPELMAARLDVLIMNAPKNVTVDGVLVAQVTRSGGSPSPLPLDPADRRFEWTCTYLITTGGG